MISRRIFYLYLIIVAIFNIAFIIIMISPKYNEITYSFEDNSIDSSGTDIDFISVDYSDANCIPSIQYGNDSSNKNLQLKDANNDGKVSIRNYWDGNHRNAIVDFDVSKSDNRYIINFFFQERKAGRIIWFQLNRDDIKCRESGSDWKVIKADFIEADRIYHIKIVFDDQKNNYTFYVDGNKEGIFNYDHNSKNGVDYLQIETTDANASEYSFTIDNIIYKRISSGNIVVTTAFILMEIIFLLLVTFILILNRINKRAKHPN